MGETRMKSRLLFKLVLKWSLRRDKAMNLKGHWGGSSKLG